MPGRSLRKMWRQPTQERLAFGKDMACRFAHILAPALGQLGKRLKQAAALLMQYGVDIEISGGFECLPHLLKAHEIGETGVKPAGNGWITPPVLAGKDCAGALPRPQTVESFAPVIAEIFALGVNGAAEVLRQIVAGHTRTLIVRELFSSIE